MKHSGTRCSVQSVAMMYLHCGIVAVQHQLIMQQDLLRLDALIYFKQQNARSERIVYFPCDTLSAHLQTICQPTVQYSKIHDFHLLLVMCSG